MPGPRPTVSTPFPTWSVGRGLDPSAAFRPTIVTGSSVGEGFIPPGAFAFPLTSAYTITTISYPLSPAVARRGQNKFTNFPVDLCYNRKSMIKGAYLHYGLGHKGQYRNLQSDAGTPARIYKKRKSRQLVALSLDGRGRGRAGRRVRRVDHQGHRLSDAPRRAGRLCRHQRPAHRHRHRAAGRADAVLLRPERRRQGRCAGGQLHR